MITFSKQKDDFFTITITITTIATTAVTTATTTTFIASCCSRPKYHIGFGEHTKDCLHW
jgi:hypothetical protein